MEVHPTPGQEALWEENERRRADILEAVDEAEACIAQGKIRHITSEQQITDLVEATKRRGMERLLSEQNTAR